MFIYTSKDSTTCAEIYIHIYVHMHINVYLYTFMFEYTCMYKYIFMYIFIIYIQAKTALHALMLQEVERMQEVHTATHCNTLQHTATHCNTL